MSERTWERIPLTASQDTSLKVLTEHGVRATGENETWGFPFHYMSFDPGKVTGWASFHENGMPAEMGHIPNCGMGIAKFLQGLHFEEDEKPKVIIYEVYQVRGRAQRVDDNSVRTMGAIKVIKTFAGMIGAKLIPQQASILPIAAKFSGMEMPRDHSKSHQISAFNHGWYYLTQGGIVVPRIKWPEG